jgi:hypothetical protein
MPLAETSVLEGFPFIRLEHSKTLGTPDEIAKAVVFLASRMIAAPSGSSGKRHGNFTQTLSW